ncbi:MAG: DUF1361 domain-containing protein [Oscillatoriales cyanobacterium C42_A2020_001]|nr:DUF1361 domain-containing protein [Leptolyngbyaceae cyanobacterium C42_A2020_001]
MTWMTIWYALPFAYRWMAWNLLLALMPWLLSVWLFQTGLKRSIVWWVGFVVFIVFLPNAPYTLTDLIHLVEEIQRTDSLLLNTLVILPKFALFVLLGFAAYVVSLVNLGQYLQRQGMERFVFPAELVLHGLSAVGVYLGRFERFNSWDLATRPVQVMVGLFKSLFDGRSLMIMALSFSVIAILYWLFKQITLALMLQQQYRKMLHPQS